MSEYYPHQLHIFLTLMLFAENADNNLFYLRTYFVKSVIPVTSPETSSLETFSKNVQCQCQNNNQTVKLISKFTSLDTRFTIAT